jgi:uncharacterized lipoprotein YajG
MKKILILLALLIPLALVAACANRSITQPVDPIFASTPTPSWSYGVVVTPTPNP